MESISEELHVRVSLAIWDRTVLPATRHKRTYPALTPASEGWYSIYLPRRDGRLSWPSSRTRTIAVLRSVVTWPCGTAFQLISHKPTLTLNDSKFKRLLKTFLFGSWDRGALWLTVKAAPQVFLLTYSRCELIGWGRGMGCLPPLHW